MHSIFLKKTTAALSAAVLAVVLAACGSTGGAVKTADLPAGLLFSFAGKAEPVAKPEAGTIPTVFIIGDSTACNYTANKAPRMGWGQVFGNYLGANIKLVNAAQSGAGTRTFLYEGLFTRVTYDMKPGDFLIIQFGHNDAKVGDLRFADANGEYQENLEKFIEEARALGVTSIVLSSIERLNFGPNGKIVPSHGAYPEAAAKVAAKTGMGFINMTAKTAALYEKAGPEGSKKIFLQLAAGENPNYPKGVADDAHLQENGAIEVAKLVCEGLKEIKSPLAAYLK